MSCVILLFMKDMVSFLGKFSVATSTITDEPLSFILFYSSVQDVLYSYTQIRYLTYSHLTICSSRDIINNSHNAGMAELADALDLGSSVPDVQVQVLLPAPVKNRIVMRFFGGFL